MLGDIGAVEGLPALSDPSDPRTLAEFVERDLSRLLVKVRTPEEILPELDAALAARFPAVPPERLQRNLLRPLKKAVGNAHKRGNQCAGDKWITVEAIVTREGAFIEVSDEGQGFDFAATYERFRSGQSYFAHKGSGFRRYAQASAVVSFANGGRTFRACFRPKAAGPVRPSAR
jgi:hypothetical protein